MRTSFVLSVLAGIGICAVWALDAPGAEMDVVRDGKAVATVVVAGAPAAAKPAEQPPTKGKKRRARGGRGGPTWNDAAAARLLVDWIEKITDVRLPVAESAPPGAPAIYVGAAARKAGLTLDDVESLTDEGVRIVCDGRRVLLSGQNGPSTVKAACRLLEELGCRYFMSGQIGEVYPRQKTLTVKPLRITEKPALRMRKVWGSDELWKLWNGCGGESFETGHAWNQYVSRGEGGLEALFEEHPEYFPMRGGERRLPGGQLWLCSSNPGLRKMFADVLVEGIRGGRLFPTISPPDGRGYCQCPTCTAQDDPNSIEPSSNTICMTNRFVDFYLYLSKRAAEANPKAILNFYCYADYTEPPTSVRELPDNLCPWPAPIRYCRFHGLNNPNCPSCQQLRKVIDGWAKISKHLGYRTYNYNLSEVCVPFSKVAVWRHDIPYLKSKGVIAINNESMEAWHIYPLNLYFAARIMYDTQADADAILDDYFLKFFGPDAGPFMKDYWMGIDRAFEDLRCHSGSFYAIHLVYTPEFLARCRSLMDKAAAAAKDNETYAARVAIHAEGLHNAELYARLREAMNAGDFARAKKVYEELLAAHNAQIQAGYGWNKQAAYAQRFLGKTVTAGAAATAPPNKLVQVLPDRWQFTWDEADEGEAKGFHKADLDDSGWKTVATYSATLDAQGLPDKMTVLWYRTSFQAPADHGKLVLFFAEVDGKSKVFINGQPAKLLAPDRSGQMAEVELARQRNPFTADISDAVRPGRNVVAVRVDHSGITELFLGGIIRPVLLIQKGG